MQTIDLITKKAPKAKVGEQLISELTEEQIKKYPDINESKSVVKNLVKTLEDEILFTNENSSIEFSQLNKFD